MKKPAKSSDRAKPVGAKTPLLDRRGGSGRLLAADGVVENSGSPPYEGGVAAGSLSEPDDGVVLSATKDGAEPTQIDDLREREPPRPPKRRPPLLRKEGSFEETPPSNLPFDPIPLDEVFRRSAYDLERSTNAYGREIFVEEWEANTGKPRIWYEFNKQKHLLKRTRSHGGILITDLGKTHYL